MAHDGTWTLRWCEHSTGGRLDDRNLASEDWRARSKGKLGEDGPDRWARLSVTAGR
jgi:hypothetical protein